MQQRLQLCQQRDQASPVLQEKWVLGHKPTLPLSLPSADRPSSHHSTQSSSSALLAGPVLEALPMPRCSLQQIPALRLLRGELSTAFQETPRSEIPQARGLGKADGDRPAMFKFWVRKVTLPVQSCTLGLLVHLPDLNTNSSPWASAVLFPSASISFSLHGQCRE